MKCVFCGNKETKVTDSRESIPRIIRRRRECLSCKKRFTTRERSEKDDLDHLSLKLEDMTLGEVFQLLGENLLPRQD